MSSVHDTSKDLFPNETLLTTDPLTLPLILVVQVYSLLVRELNLNFDITRICKFI